MCAKCARTGLCGGQWANCCPYRDRASSPLLFQRLTYDWTANISPGRRDVRTLLIRDQPGSADPAFGSAAFDRPPAQRPQTENRGLRYLTSLT